jgi:protein-tyrosine phosphatase
MIEVHPKLYVGTESDCFFDSRDDWVVVHACKSPCHQKAVGYHGNLPSTHPNYLVLERGTHLFLNMIDPDTPLFKLPLFDSALSFIDRYFSTHKVLIHCNKGNSRAPSLALLYLAKRARVINSESYATAARDFRAKFPSYQPSLGIQIYLTEHWSQIE